MQSKNSKSEISLPGIKLARIAFPGIQAINSTLKTAGKLPITVTRSRQQIFQKKVSMNKNSLKQPFQSLPQTLARNRIQQVVISENEKTKKGEIILFTEEPFNKKHFKTVKPAGPVEINVNLKIALNPVSLTTTRLQEIPCMVEVSSPELPGNPRSGIDIICVIDVSGSMQGEKLELVKKTLLFMIKRLDISDRVALVTFSDDAKQKSGLVCMNETGKTKLSNIIKSLNIEGNTEILEGLELSFEILHKRQVPNQITSVILLSDGVDNNVSSAMRRLNALFIKYSSKIKTGFVIHTFGYGSDHQADLMNSMASKTNGGFYFVEQEKLIPQAFSDCLGEMMSVVADSVRVELSTIPARIPFSLTKVYSETGDLSFRMPAILSGNKKKTVFLVKFLPTDLIFAPGHVETLVKARVRFQVTATAEQRTVESFLRVQIVNETDKTEVELDEDVMVNFYRAKCADILKEAANLGDNNKLQEARVLLTDAVQEFKTCIFANNPTVLIFIKNLESSILRLANRSVYEYGGKALMKSLSSTHLSERCIYKNSLQTTLLRESEEEFS